MRRHGREEGFTLIEILVVILIIGLLASMVAMRGDAATDEARLQKARVDVEQIYGAATHFYIENGRLPQGVSELIAPRENGPPYLRGYGSTPKDPWGNEYELLEGEKRHDWQVVSHGQDGIAGTEDDISSATVKDG